MPGTITAVIPTYNRAAMLGDAIESIRSQNRPVDEIIIWDDGSTDGTEAAARSAGAVCGDRKADGPLPRLRYFRTENGGKSRALNRALAQARGDYIWVCDDDDIALPTAAATLAARLDADPSLTAAAGGYRRFSDDEATGARREIGPGYWPDLSRGTILRHLLEDIFLFQNATMVRRAAFDAVGPFREDLPRAIDYDMIVRLACHGPIEVLETPLFLQRKHDGDRGPAAARHAAARSEETWKAADRAVFAPFHDSLPMRLYEAMFHSPDPALVRRAAYLQRACVFARRTDWQRAVEDFAAAARIAPDTALSDVEIAICRRALSGKHGCVEVLDRDVQGALRDVALQSSAGGDIARALVRGIVWRGRAALRRRDYAEAFAIAGLSARLRLAARKRGTAPDRLEERDRLPPRAHVTI
ncbi:glycosyltransferase [Sulfitobacter aestuarii]|uniref:Glycosyltransferase n=1 Tax=Sulfitobacter aestuarii TaxID=2161676 RepID=A0ABW5U3K1_9RHOB